jgi:hypothetical protein
MWGISWANARLMISDSIQVEYKRTTSSDVSETIDMNNPEAMSLLIKMAQGK